MSGGAVAISRSPGLPLPSFVARYMQTPAFCLPTYLVWDNLNVGHLFFKCNMTSNYEQILSCNYFLQNLLTHILLELIVCEHLHPKIKLSTKTIFNYNEFCQTLINYHLTLINKFWSVKNAIITINVLKLKVPLMFRNVNKKSGNMSDYDSLKLMKNYLSVKINLL